MKNHANDNLENILRKYAALGMFEDCSITSPTSPGPDGDTPFHIAAYDGDIDVVKIMLPFVSDMNLKGDIGNTPLHYAISGRQLPMVEMLICSGANLSQGNDYGVTPFSYMEGDELFSLILGERQHPGAT
ncbi:ankyrin repeat domain-containing protein [Collimonas humicola]|uniref:ankyrin repeat domain-containing protein n=1 Tax=Collimonas humicola TaxID=2825886 RepID=UPI001B8C328D|nr:ankyrin repeat domain-containing protein [Collimonas humicola]